MADETSDRARSLALLESVHQFPGPFQFRVVVLPESEAAAVDAMCAAVESSDPIEARAGRPSRTGRYLSIHLTLRVQRAEEVLAVYAALKTVEGVITVF